MEEELLTALKALSDASRLRIVGLLAARAMPVEEVARELKLSPGTVVHHLKRLREAGLVEPRPRPPYMEYSLRLQRLSEIGAALGRAGRERGPERRELTGPQGPPRPASEARVLEAFLEDGRLARIPAHEKKRLIVLRHLAETVFTDERPYPEKEVNQRLAALHPDVAALRRYLVDHGFMARGRGEYRLRPREEWPKEVTSAG